MAENNCLMAEFQGLYGPFTMHERVLQKIWKHRDFDGRDLRLADGRPFDLLAPGEWNLHGGPDFLGARLRLDGRELRGDVEVHFHPYDWQAHGHQLDPAYGNVILHVVLFPPEATVAVPVGEMRPRLPTLVLLPRLLRGLEEYAADDALESITARDEWRRFAALGRKDPREIRRILRQISKDRWLQKVNYASLRIAKLGWAEAAHQTALEILGYKRNRASMLLFAAMHPLPVWSAEGFDPIALLSSAGLHWELQGTRPANQPRTRLRQYAAWTRACPDWPEQLARIAGQLPVLAGELSVGEARTRQALADWREILANAVMGGAVGGTRAETLVCDGLLPLAAARTGSDLFALWFNWYLGDVPFSIRQAMPQLGVAEGRTEPVCHGVGQGLLGWLLQMPSDASS